MPFSDYRVMGLVGQGQFAQVYCAVHKRTGQFVAIKQTRHASEQASQESFVLSELCHPNVVCCRAIAPTKAGYQFVLDYCEAGTLRSQMDLIVTSSTQSNEPPLLSSIATDILKGLSYIHAQQVIHGDLKPENILLTYQSQAKDKRSRLMARIGDFGSARFVEMPSQSRKEIGSPTYAAPERFYGHSSYASDLYSVGVILYELLLGDRPFSGSPDHLRQAHQTQSVPFPKSLSIPAKQFLERSLHKHPNRRFGSADEMLSAFQALSHTDVIEGLKVYAIAEENNLPRPSAHIKQLKPAITLFSTNLDEKPRGEIHQLLTVSQGCFAITDRAVYRLDKRGTLDPIVQLNKPSWIAISPDGHWLVSLPKRSERPAQSRGQFMALQNFVGLEAEQQRSIVFQGKLLRSIQASVVQVLAMDRRYIVRVLTSPHAAKSCLECFTRKGKLVGDLPLNVSLSYAALSSDPYQIAALSTADASEVPKLLLISLRPFQVNSVALSLTDLRSSPRGIVGFPWGYAVVDDGGCLFLDRLGHLVGRLNLMGVSALAPLTDGRALVAIAIPQSAKDKNNPLEDTFSGESSLFVIDLKLLSLDLVF